MNNIFDLIFLILGVVLALLMKNNFTIEDEDDKSTKLKKINIKIEQIEEIYYAWKDNDFIVQSKQIEDVLDHIKQKFPNKNYLIVSNRNLEKWLQTKEI
jgi:hypothetical protein